MRISARGQVTIPIELRQAAGLHRGTEVEFRLAGKVVSIVKAENGVKATRGARLIQLLRATGDITMTTDEIMTLTRGE